MCMRIKQSTEIEYLGARIENVFKNNNISIVDILNNKYTLHQLLSIKNLGRKSINGIRENFKQIGYIFPDENMWLNPKSPYGKGKQLNKLLENTT